MSTKKRRVNKRHRAAPSQAGDGRRDWDAKVAKIRVKLENATATDEDIREYVRSLNTEPDDPDAFSKQIIGGLAFGGNQERT